MAASNSSTVNTLADAEALIKKAKENTFGYLTKRDLDSNPITHNAKQILLNYKLIAEDSDNYDIFNLTERGWNFKSFQDEKDQHEISLKKSRYDAGIAKWTYYTYWIAFFFSIAGLIISIIALLKTSK